MTDTKHTTASAPSGDAEKQLCKNCEGSGVIPTGMDESPESLCSRCNGDGYEPAAAPAEAESAGEALKEMEARKDEAYYERNQVVAALAKCFPSGVARTAIEGWSEDWHGCVYIDLPTGQVSWHFHDSHAHLFAGLPPYTGTWDGHDTPEKYRRVNALSIASAPTARKEAAGVTDGVLNEAQRQSVELVVSRLEQIKHIADDFDVRAHAKEALECANAILSGQSAPTLDRAPQEQAAERATVEVKVDRNRVWIVKGVQSFMLAYEADTAEELDWYAGQLHTVLSTITPCVKSAERAAVPEGWKPREFKNFEIAKMAREHGVQISGENLGVSDYVHLTIDKLTSLINAAIKLAAPVAQEGKAVDAVRADEWSYSTDEERYQEQEQSRIAIIRHALGEIEANDDGTTDFWIGRNLRFIPRVSAALIVEQLQEQAFEECGEYAETYLEDVTKEEESELENLVNAWTKRIDRSNFWTVTDVEHFTVESAREYLASLDAAQQVINDPPAPTERTIDVDPVAMKEVLEEKGFKTKGDAS